MTKETIADLYLDLESLKSLSPKENETIHDYYRSMISFASENMPNAAQSFYNTLYKAGYLKSMKTEDRDDKIKQING